MPQIIAVMPVFNEEKTLQDILSRTSRQADILVCVNDGSRDGTHQILRDFAKRRENTFLLSLPRNLGMAGALKQGFLFVLYLSRIGAVGEGDVVATLDADGQHKPEYLRELARYLEEKKVDIVLTRRDFSLYPPYKVWGNRFLTLTNSLLSGRRYRDVESGLRLLKVKTLPAILRYYTGVRYSCAQEIALLSARAGFQIDNDYRVDIAYYRPGTTLVDGFTVLALSLWAYVRWFFGFSSRLPPDSPGAREAFEESQKLWPKERAKKPVSKEASRGL